MKTASKILEGKGYEKDQIDSIISWGNGNKDSLDQQARIAFGLADYPIHLWESYDIGDADPAALDKVAKQKGFEDYEELLQAATYRLNDLADQFPSRFLNREIGDIIPERGKIIDLKNGYEVCIISEVWYNEIAFGTIFKKGESPSADADIDWSRMDRDVIIKARGGSYGNEMFDCVIEGHHGDLFNCIMVYA